MFIIYHSVKNRPRNYHFLIKLKLNEKRKQAHKTYSVSQEFAIQSQINSFIYKATLKLVWAASVSLCFISSTTGDDFNLRNPKFKSSPISTTPTQALSVFLQIWQSVMIARRSGWVFVELAAAGRVNKCRETSGSVMAGSKTEAWGGKRALWSVTASLNSHTSTGAFHLPHTPSWEKHYPHYRITKWTITMRYSRDQNSSRQLLLS